MRIWPLSIDGLAGLRYGLASQRDLENANYIS